MIKPTVIAYWLIPTEPAYSSLQRIINDLARRYEAPVFEPHVTVHVGANRAYAARQALADAARGCKRITLEVVGVGQSDAFTKTLFVEFAFSPELRRLNQIIRSAADDSLRYRLKPHLSLLYKKMPVKARRELSVSTRAPLSDVTFDAVKAIRCISPTQTRAEVEAWRVVAVTALSAFLGERSGVEESGGII